MSNKFKKLKIKLASPKAKNLGSLKSPTSTKAVSLQTNSFKNVGLETIIQELVEVKREKISTLEQRKIQEIAICQKLIKANAPKIDTKSEEVKEKYKKNKVRIVENAREQMVILDNYIQAGLAEKEELIYKLQAKQCKNTIKILSARGITHEISEEISEEISKISVWSLSSGKLTEEISKVLSIDELQPFYSDISVSLSGKIFESMAKTEKIQEETDKFVSRRKELSNQLILLNQS